MKAAIDIGSNSVRLLAADVEGGEVAPKLTLRETTRLGQAGNILSGEPLDRTIAVIGQFIALVREKHGEVDIRAFATSAVREADNRGEFCALVKARYGIEVHVLSREEEAMLAAYAIPIGSACVDIGGNSTEMLVRDECRYAESFLCGALRLSLCGIPEAGDITIELETAFHSLDAARCANRPFYGAGGSVTTLAAYELSLSEFDPLRVDGHTLSISEIRRLISKIEAMPISERKAEPMLADRADTIVYGARILLYLMERIHAKEITAVTRDNLFAYLGRWDLNLSP